MSRPLIKWVGGKTQLLPQLLDLFPKKIRTYHEPFLGGGAVFFALAREGRFERAVLSDHNPRLINLYRATRDYPERVTRKLDLLAQGYPTDPETTFKLWRAWLDREEEGRGDPTYQAALFIALNKTCFNGVYRENQQGGFNVPWNKRKAVTFPSAEDIRAASAALNGFVRLLVGDFEAAVVDAREGDLVYFDPPYLPASPTASFTSYTAAGFELEDHRRLARVFGELAERGVSVVASNADVPLVHQLYADFEIQSVPARRSVAARGTSRVPVGEVLVASRRPVVPLSVRQGLVV